MFGRMPKQLNRYIVLFFLLTVVACQQAVRQTSLQGFKKINDSLFYRYEGKGSEQLINHQQAIYLERSFCNAYDLAIPCQEAFATYDTLTEDNKENYQWLMPSLTKLHHADTVLVAMHPAQAKRFLHLTPSIQLAESEWLYLRLVVTQTILNPTQEAASVKQDDSATEEKPKEAVVAAKKETQAPVEKEEEVLVKAEPKPTDMPPANADAFEKEAFTLRYFLEYTRPELLKYEVEPGLFIHVLNKGKGRSVKFGDIVSIDYVGRFAMNGKKFDDSSLSPESFDFVMGKPDQLLKGIEKALYKLREGGKAEVFFTSRYGYGANGSSTGIVGKYKSLSFVVRLKKIRNK